MMDGEVTPPRRGKGGCLLGCLGTVFCVVMVGYILVFHSPLPIKVIAGKLVDSANSNGYPIVVKGVGGSLKKGVTIKHLEIPGDAGTSTITGLAFKYKNFTKWFSEGQVVITELSAVSSDIVVDKSFFNSDESDPGMTVDTQHTGGNGNQSLVQGGGYFQLHLLSLQNTRIRSADGDMDINIPLIQMTGLRIDSDNFDIDDFKIESDYVSASLADADEVLIDGQAVTFDQKLHLVVKPEIHKSVKRDIPVTLEFSQDKGQSITRISAFDGALEQVDFSEGKSFVVFNQLSIDDYLAIDEHVIPNQLTLTARENHDVAVIEAGSFVIGNTRFTFSTMSIDTSDEQAFLVAEGRAGELTVTAEIQPDKGDKAWPPVNVRLKSSPEVSAKELLSNVYFSKSYDALSAGERTRVDALNGK